MQRDFSIAIKIVGVKLEFLGTAGYHPTNTRQTNCIFLPDAAPDCAFVLDAGTGLHRLTNRPLPAQTHIILSHAHLDHVCGLTYLLDIVYAQPTQITLHADAKTLDAVQNTLFNSPLFPLQWTYPTLQVLAGETFEIAGVKIRSFALNHPGGSLGFRFDWPETSLAYVTDTVGDGAYLEKVRGVDVLIHERNFKDGWETQAAKSGHCTSLQVAQIASASTCKTLLLTHFNPLDSDDDLWDDSLRAIENDLQVFAAHDEMKVEF